jgi:cardiolipin synthase A/B
VEKSQRKANAWLQALAGWVHHTHMTGLPEYPPVSARVDGHAVQLYFSGKERLDAVLDIIATARSSLRLFFYIFSGDASGIRVRDALIAACARKVKVTVLVDGFGCADVPDSFYRPLVDAGAIFDRFHARWGRAYLLRNHQKMIVADDARALVGGANISDDYFSDDPAGQGWHDLYLKLEGPMAARLGHYFDALHRWMESDNPSIRRLVRILSRWSDKSGKIRWLMGGPFRRLSPLTRSIKLDLDTAKKLDIIQAYFAPNWGMLRRITRIEKRGGVVRLITAQKSDNRTTIAAARHCYRRILRGGIEVYEYQPEKLHMKLIVVDDMTYIGSANFDMRSLFLNAEIMVRIEDATLARSLRDFFSAHTPHCGRITAESHRANAGLFSRIKWLLAYFAVSTLDFTVTRRNLRRL